MPSTATTCEATREQPEKSHARRGGKIFGSDSRAGVAVLLLVKKPGESHGAKLYYNDIGDYLKREEKLEILEVSSLATTDWRVITPNVHGDWVNQRSEGFLSLRPLSSRRKDEVE